MTDHLPSTGTDGGADCPGYIIALDVVDAGRNCALVPVEIGNTGASALYIRPWTVTPSQARFTYSKRPALRAASVVGSMVAVRLEADKKMQELDKESD